MGETCILKREFIFNAHDEKAFDKLRNHQFPRKEQGIVNEPLANAFDQQQGSEPVTVTVSESGPYSVLTYRDNGVGLTSENLEALHFIGKTNKRAWVEKYLGRFGMGFTGAFHSDLGIEKVEMVSRVCGTPSRVIYRCQKGKIPTWVKEDLKENCEGLKLSFFIPKGKMASVLKDLEELLEKTVIPISYNGRIYHNPPETLDHDDQDIYLFDGQDPQIHYWAHITEDPSRFRCRDFIRIYLRGMPVEEGDMYTTFVSRFGDKMPQNYYRRPYMKDESCIVLSRRAEPTVGRDKLVRNKAFEDIERKIETLRAEALRELMKKSLDSKASSEIFRYAVDMAAANLRSLSDLLTAYIKGDALSQEKAYLVPLLEDLLDYPLFLAFGCEPRLSAREILNADMPGRIYFYASQADTCEFLEGRHRAPFILEERSYSFSGLWGGHEKTLVDSLLKPLVECRSGSQMIHLEDLIWDDDRMEELEKMGVINMNPIQIKMVDDADNRFSEFLDRLKSILNRSWFREALSRFHPPKKVRIKLVETLNAPLMGDLVAGVLRGSKNRDELVIGLNTQSLTLRGLVQHPNGHFAFLPILCHELSHRRRTVVGAEKTVPHGQGFYFDRVRLEERVLSGCVRYLLGKELSGGDEGNDAAEILVL